MSTPACSSGTLNLSPSHTIGSIEVRCSLSVSEESLHQKFSASHDVQASKSHLVLAEDLTKLVYCVNRW